MSDSIFISLDSIQETPSQEDLEQSYSLALKQDMATAFELRQEHFPNDITFHAPGLRRYRTSEYTEHNALHFTSISLTGSACALACDHCNMSVLHNMPSLPKHGGSLFDMVSEFHEKGTRGILISGGSDKEGRVPLLKHMPDIIRIRRELDMTIRVHPGLPDEETCAGLAEADIDGAMVDIIGDNDTIRDVYHLPHKTIDDFDALLERLERHGVPAIPHIILGLHWGEMRGEQTALEIIARHKHRLLVLVILMSLSDAPMAKVIPPPVEDITEFFAYARNTLPQSPIMLGCARPIGNMKLLTDRAAIDAGFNGIAYPTDGIITYAEERGLKPKLVDACCGVQW
jgi:lipoyl synthase